MDIIYAIGFRGFCSRGSFCQRFLPILLIGKHFDYWINLFNRHVSMGLFLGAVQWFVFMPLNLRAITAGGLHLLSLSRFSTWDKFSVYDVGFSLLASYGLYVYKPWVYAGSKKTMIISYLGCLIITAWF